MSRCSQITKSSNHYHYNEEVNGHGLEEYDNDDEMMTEMMTTMIVLKNIE